jgi:FixJ family two-component response regulator
MSQCVNGIDSIQQQRPSADIVYLIDGDTQYRYLLKATLAEEVKEVIAFGSACEFWRYQRSDAVACIVLDPRLPDIDGVEFQRQIRRSGGPPVIMITGDSTVELSVSAMKAGAIEFLTKPVSSAVLLAAVRAALEENRISQERDRLVTTLQQRFSNLTPREKQVFPLVISGLRNKQAAWALGITEVTLQVHRGQIMKKMAASSFADLVRMGEQLKMVSGPIASPESPLNSNPLDAGRVNRHTSRSESRIV